MVIDRLSAEQTWDLCIVGTGPVGMATALEFERLGHEVLVIESGGLEPNGDASKNSRANIIDPDRHAPMEIAVCLSLIHISARWRECV